VIGELLKEQLEKSWKVAGPGMFYFGRMVICSKWPTSSFAASYIFDSTLELPIWNMRGESWLSQVNHIFSCLGVTSNLEDYGTSEIILGQFLINLFN
jgi:hypothetical protein